MLALENGTDIEMCRLSLSVVGIDRPRHELVRRCLMLLLKYS